MQGKGGGGIHYVDLFLGLSLVDQKVDQKVHQKVNPSFGKVMPILFHIHDLLMTNRHDFLELGTKNF